MNSKNRCKRISFILSMTVLLLMMIGVTSFADENLDPPKRIIVELHDAPVIDLATILHTTVDAIDQVMGKGYTSNRQKSLVDKHMIVLSDLKLKGISAKPHKHFVNGFNGFSITATREELSAYVNHPLVKKVTEVNVYSEPEPNMIDSNYYTKSDIANQIGFDGEGQVVAIIDTGIDYTHQDMILDTGALTKLSEQDVQTKLNLEGQPLLGNYFTDKVPYGYNYFDLNNDVIDTRPGTNMHGMHVAGIVGANGVIKGVAPNAQLLAMKVFSNGNTRYTYGDMIIAAIDDAIALGADVMNLSLGSSAGVVSPTDPEQVAISNAVDNGIVMSISAGNSGTFARDDVYPENPDIGVVGAPGIALDSIQVASMENYSYNYETELIVDSQIGLFGYGSDLWNLDNYTLRKISGTLEGFPNDYLGIDMDGKVAFVKRGSLSFQDKAYYASQAGASALIVYDDDSGNSFVYDAGDYAIPIMFVSSQVGQILDSLMMTEDLEFSVNPSQLIDADAGFVSDFSSWGLTPNLEFKPEIMAPGGNIYSTLNNDSYGVLSGTSMAAPQVSGGLAIVLQYMETDLKYQGIQIDTRTHAELAKKLLMNTAMPVMDLSGLTYASPRAQGAGSMNIASAIETTVSVSDSNSGKAKVSLGDQIGKDFSFDLQLRNYGAIAKTYNLDTSVQTLQLINGYSTNESMPINADVTYIVDGLDVEEITVPTNGAIELTVAISIDGAVHNTLLDAYIHGYFAEGFVTFSPVDDRAVALSVPYVGFTGDWSVPKAFDVDDYSVSSGIDTRTYYGETNLRYEVGFDVYGDPVYEPIGQGQAIELIDTAGFSPNGDGFMDYIVPSFTLLRNLQDVFFSVHYESPDAPAIEIVDYEDRLRKNYHPSSIAYEGYIKVDKNQYDWDGMLGGQKVQDGQYYYMITGTLDDGVTSKSLTMPFKIDTEAPTYVAHNYDETSDVLTFTATDDGVGIESYMLLDVSDGSVLYDQDDGMFDLSQLDDSVNTLNVAFVDYVGNEYFHSEAISLETVTTPILTVVEKLIESSDDEIVISGTVQNVINPIVTVNEHEVILNDLGSYYSFEFINANLSDGYHQLDVVLYADENLIDSQAVEVFVDSTPPSITSNKSDLYSDFGSQVVVPSDSENYDISLNISDNFPELSMSINGVMMVEETVENYPREDLVQPISRIYEDNVPLLVGLNIFEIVLTDRAGHIIQDRIEILREEEDPSALLVDEIRILDGESISMETGESITLSVNAYLKNGDVLANDPTLNVTVNTSSVTVDGFIVTAVSAGTSTIEYSKDDGLDSIEIIVIAPSPPPSGGGGTPTPIFIPPPIIPEIIIEEELIPEAASIFSQSSYINGYLDGTFKPEGLITRAEISKIIAFVLELESLEKNVFDDVPQSYWANGFINAMENESLLKGYEDGSFKPSNNITRAEMATILARIITKNELGVEDDQHHYLDLENHWAKDYIQTIYGRGIDLYPASSFFKPDVKLTRAEAVVMVNLMIGRDVDQEIDGQSFDDVPITHWAYRQIELASK